MDSQIEVYEIAQKIKSMNTESRQILLNEIFADEKVSATELLVAKIYSLEHYKTNAKNDIRKIAEAGMELGEREMRRVLKTKENTRKKTDDFYLAMVRCLLDAGAYRNTEYAKQLEASDYSSIDTEWYEWSWKPVTTLTDKETSPKVLEEK